MGERSQAIGVHQRFFTDISDIHHDITPNFTSQSKGKIFTSKFSFTVDFYR